MAETSATHFQTISSGSFGSNSGGKYGGLIQRSFTKKMKNQLAALFSYVYSVAPTFTMAHHIISFFRIFQLVGPSFGISFDNLWPPGSFDEQIMSIVSVFFQIIPVMYNDQAHIGFSIAYIAIIVIVFAIIIFSSFYYAKNANLPSFITSFLSFYFATLAQVLHPIALNITFQAISSLFAGKTEPTVFKIVIIVVTFLLTVCFIYLIVGIACRSLTFRPNSLMTVSINTWNLQFFETVLVSAFLNLASRVNNWIEYLFMVLAAAVYFASIYLPFYQGGFVHSIVEKALITSNLASGLLCIVNLVLCLMAVEATVLILFIFVIVWVVIFIAVHYFVARRNLKYLKLLDSIEEEQIAFDSLITSPNHFLNALRIGFESSHPICINWAICKMAVERWPKDPNVWFAFAKFVAIYPEETQVLEWIFISVCSSKVKGSAVQTLKEQCLTITRQRESTLSSDLKLKINKLAKQTNSTKHKLRHVWDAVIQGNISEVEDATKRAAGAIDQNKVDYQRLLRQFPNNRFVTRPYARFLIELVGDSTEANEMLDKTRLLQRGVNVNADQTHVFGLNAFHNLPDRLKIAVSNQTTQMTESVQSSFFETEQEENSQINNESVSVLKDRIERVKIPAIRNTLIMRLAILICIFIAPFVAMIVVLTVFIKSLEVPLEHMQNIALLGTHVYQVVAFSNRWIYTKLGVLDELPHIDRPVPESLGSTWDIAKQTEFIVEQMAASLQALGPFRSFERENSHISQAHKIIFTSSFTYVVCKSPDSLENVQMSLQSAVIDFIVQVSDVIGNPSIITPSIINTSKVLNLVVNSDPISMEINDALSFIIDYISELREKYKSLMLYIQIGVIIVIFFVYLISLIVQISWIKQNKESTYMCLTALPKNTISQLAENLRVLKKDNANSTSTSDSCELSKQEENILKVFNTGGSAGIKLGDMLIIVFTVVIIFGLEVAGTVLLAQLVVTETEILMQRSPQLHYVQGAYAMLISIIYVINQAAIQFTNLRVPVITVENLVKLADEQNALARHYYQMVRYGTDVLQPFEGFSAGMKHSAEIVNCTNAYHFASDIFEATDCYDADIIFTSITPFVDGILVPYKFKNLPLDPKNVLVGQLWMMTLFPVYDAFIDPMYQTIIGTISKNLDNQLDSCLSAVIPMIFIAILFESLAIFRIKMIEEHIRFVLRLLLHCQADVILQTSKIASVLSGEFSSVKYDSTTRNVAFFDTVFMNLPESIIYADNMNNIECVNKQCLVLLSCELDNVIGKPLAEVMQKFDGNTESLLHPTNGKSSKETISLKRNNEIINLSANSFPCNQKLVITMRDTTTTVRYNTLIKEERAKSDKLLSAILPISLVPRVQAGEKNISFAVQSATIVFMDIVSFTPWCGSLPADKVMSTLNSLFKKFDALVAKYSTMTKIKCIGDCYMAAGGVFSEVNQPAEHAKEVVCFGLDSLSAVKELDEELDQKLQIRVGINTGGPIVAGVLGIGKPTFEILGPAINMAQQMEHHGVPMQVHISRTVYELIYGDTFSIKERGAVEVKGGSVITYLVSGKK